MRAREELEQFGLRILDMSRTELLLSMRFLAAALDALEQRMDLRTASVGTDGYRLLFNPSWLMMKWLEDPVEVNRCWLHMLLHCIFRHLYSSRLYEDRELWDLSCDIAAESIIDGMSRGTGRGAPAVARTVTDRREDIYRELEQEVRVLTAERIYDYHRRAGTPPAEIDRLAGIFLVDDHGFWERPDEDRGQDEQRRQPREGAGGAGRDDDDRERQGRMRRARDREDKWRSTGEQIRAALQAGGMGASEEMGELERVLTFQMRRRTDYRDYLRRFSMLREVVGIDPDSFDYGFYNYGMEVYGNMPLIEENEFREEKRVDELVIAIDTSASCQKSLVQHFLNETASILLSGEHFFRRVHIHVIECDDRVQFDRRIDSPEDMRRYAEGFTLHGGYGTDFRPVFAYVDRLRARGELKGLKGLLYFTDGAGTYPAKPTDYDTAFVFWQDEELDDTKVPDWAMKLYITDGPDRSGISPRSAGGEHL